MLQYAKYINDPNGVIKVINAGASVNASVPASTCYTKFLFSFHVASDISGAISYVYTDRIRVIGANVKMVARQTNPSTYPADMQFHVAKFTQSSSGEVNATNVPWLLDRSTLAGTCKDCNCPYATPVFSEARKYCKLVHVGRRFVLPGPGVTKFDGYRTYEEFVPIGCDLHVPVAPGLNFTQSDCIGDTFEMVLLYTPNSTTRTAFVGSLEYTIQLVYQDVGSSLF